MNYTNAALGYLDTYYQSFADENFYFGFPFIKELAAEGLKLAKAEKLEGKDYDNALLIICFRFAGNTHMVEEDDTKYKLLKDFTLQINYPENEAATVGESIRSNINFQYPSNKIEKVAWDAIGYRFAADDLIVHISFLKEEVNRLHNSDISEVEMLQKEREHFIKTNFYTKYGKEQYADKRDKNLTRLNKRIQKLQATDKKLPKEAGKLQSNLSDKETEDLFKIAFRNYVNLVSVADSKAGLLINVNSIIISVVIAFVVSRTEKYPFLTLPSFMLLAVAFITILLSILASRPQKNFFIQDKSSKSYQTFFFGSFDLMGNEFSKATWDNYSVELDELLKGGKENVYEEMYKETFNVRKVLGRKFTLLSYAYLVFIIGLFVSIIAFFISVYDARP